jgi:tRNA-binding protein
MPKPIAPFSNFAALDIRVGTILSATKAATNKPTYRMVIDFGSEIGQRTSCGAYTNYSAEELVGKQVIAIVNFGPKKMGPETSEALVLGVPNKEGPGTIFLTVDTPGPNGLEIF